MYSNKFWSFKNVCVSHFQWLNPRRTMAHASWTQGAFDGGLGSQSVWSLFSDITFICRDSCFIIGGSVYWAERTESFSTEAEGGHTRPCEAVASKPPPELSQLPHPACLHPGMQMWPLHKIHSSGLYWSSSCMMAVPSVTSNRIRWE